MDVTGGKITISLKNCTKIENEETHAHRKRARSALSKERTLDLRQMHHKSGVLGPNRQASWNRIVVKRTVAKRDPTVYHKWCITECTCWMIYWCLTSKSEKIIYIPKLSDNYHRLLRRVVVFTTINGRNELISFAKNGWDSSTAVCTWQNATCFAHWTNIPFRKRRSEPTDVLQGQLNPTGLTRENVLVKLSYVKLCKLIRYQQTGLMHHIT